MFYTAKKIDEKAIEYAESVEEAKALIAQYEEEDKCADNYEEGYYCVFDESGKAVA